MTLSRRESLESVTITVVPFFPTLTFLFIYFSIINGLGYDIYLTYSSYLFVIASSCSNGREDDKFQLIRSIFSIDLANS